MLAVLEKSGFKRWQKAALVALLFVISAAVGGWIITPSLPLLKCYNGVRGRDLLGGRFYYVFYPVRFLVLSAIKVLLVDEMDTYYLYLGVHVVTLMLILGMLFTALTVRPTRGQNAEKEMYSCRVGGDEFCVYLRNTTSKNEITDVINNVMSQLAHTFRAEDNVQCTISTGTVSNDLPDRLMNCSEMYSIADDRLYDAKKAGKNTYRN